MPAINLKKTLYDELIRMGKNPSSFANEATRDKLMENKKVTMK